MKILYVSGDMGIEVGGRKGASTHVRETCHALKRFGHDVRILTPTPGDLSYVQAPVITVQAPRAKWMGSDMRYIVLNRRMRRAITHQIKTFQPDAIYERYSLYQTAGLELAVRHNIPRILEVNTLLAREQAHRLHFPWLAERVEHALWRRERAMICVSQTLKQLMTDTAGLDESKMNGFEVSPVAVDTNVFHPSMEPAEEVRKLARGRKIAGYVGTLTAWHGVDLFFETAQIMKDRNAPVLLLAVGGEPERVERLRKRVREAGLENHLLFYGSIDFQQVPPFLAAMDMCLIADTQDWSSPTKFFEFAAMERPIIASRSPSVLEVFGDSGTAGLFFERGNAEDMADKMLMVLNDHDLSERLGRAARQRVLQRYTWECNVKTIMCLYEKMNANGAHVLPGLCPPPPGESNCPRDGDSP